MFLAPSRKQPNVATVTLQNQCALALHEKLRSMQVAVGSLLPWPVTHADVTCTKRWMTKPAHVTKSVARCWRTKVDEPSRWPPSCHGHGGQSGWPWRRGLGDVRMLSGCSIMSVVQWVLGASCIALNTQ